MKSLADDDISAGKPDRAIPLLEEFRALQTARSGADHPDTGLARTNLGVAYKSAGRWAEALPLLEEGQRASRKYPALREVGTHLLDVYVALGQPDKATALAREMLAEGRAAMPAGSPELAGLLAQTGSALLGVKVWVEAEPLLRESLAIREKAEPGGWRTFNTKSMLGAALLGQKKYNEAEPLLRAGYEGIKQRADKIPPQAKSRPGEALDRLIELAEATGKPDEAKAWRAEKAKLAPP
jgi:tetratricopeptide (TPR) repeat protein